MNTIGYHGRRSSIDLSDSTRANAWKTESSRNLNLRTSPLIRGAASAPWACSHGPVRCRSRGITRRPAPTPCARRRSPATRYPTHSAAERLSKRAGAAGPCSGSRGAGSKARGSTMGRPARNRMRGSRVRNRNRRLPTPAGSRPTSNEASRPTSHTMSAARRARGRCSPHCSRPLTDGSNRSPTRAANRRAP